MPQRKHGEKNLAYLEPAGMHNYVEVNRLWIDEKRHYHGKKISKGSEEKGNDKRWEHWPEIRKLGM